MPEPQGYFLSYVSFMPSHNFKREIVTTRALQVEGNYGPLPLEDDAGPRLRFTCRGALTQPPRFCHGRRKRLPRHDLLGEERWPFLSGGEGPRASLSRGFY